MVQTACIKCGGDHEGWACPMKITASNLIDCGGEMTYEDRKAQRKKHYETEVKGWKQRKCRACNGSGRYDSNGAPPCSSCDGTGRERYKPE